MSFFLMLNIREDIMKNAGNQTVDVPKTNLEQPSNQPHSNILKNI